MNKLFIKNIILNNLSLGLQFGSRWLLSISLLAMFGLRSFGVFSFIYSIANILVSVLPFGSQFYLIKEVQVDKSNEKELSKSIVFLLFLTGIVGVLIFILNLLFENDYGSLLYLGLVLGVVFSFNNILFSYLKGVGDFGFELKINGVFSILVFGLIGFLYLYGSLEVEAILYLLIIFNLITTFLAIYFSRYLNYRDILKHIDFSKQNLGAVFQQRKYFGLQDIVTASFVQGGMLLLPLLILDDVYGMYRGMLLIVAPFSLLNVAFSQVLLSQIKDKSKEQIGKVFHLLQRIMVPLLITVLVGLYVFKAIVLQYVAKLPLNDTTKVAFVGVCLIILSSFIYSGYEMLLIALDKQKLRLDIMIIGAVVNLITIFCLLPQYGLIGAISTNVISSVIVFGFIMFIGEMELKKVSKA
ncbi:Membrane protein involved in the export of O-antigen and teichoic acid [Myroides guanonis]|uniref:Membrane protein involved in the export of O-antigen and teichoic acid n=1 Tax=Myroides guanonis TaxID=1150112 RepID=A0A1I3RJW1_9FLAO|nr:Membrane protein involved in the export of O-antigen and teichoic acid [Myroides guanonis]